MIKKMYTEIFKWYTINVPNRGTLEQILGECIFVNNRESINLWDMYMETDIKSPYELVLCDTCNILLEEGVIDTLEFAIIDNTDNRYDSFMLDNSDRGAMVNEDCGSGYTDKGWLDNGGITFDNVWIPKTMLSDIETQIVDILNQENYYDNEKDLNQVLGVKLDSPLYDDLSRADHYDCASISGDNLVDILNKNTMGYPFHYPKYYINEKGVLLCRKTQ